MRQVLHEFACLSSYEHARFPNLNLQKKTFVFKAFLRFSGLPKWVHSSIEFAHKTRFHDLNYIRLISKNAIKTNWFLTISHCVKSSFISMSSVIYKFWKHKNVKNQLVFVPFLMKRLRPGIVQIVNFYCESLSQTQNSHFFVFAVDQTSQNKIVKKTLVFIAFPLQKIRFCIAKNAIDTTALYSLDFRKRHKNQCFF